MINREDIIAMAREAGFMSDAFVPDLERFAALVASRVAVASASVEREACAKVCDDLWQEDGTAYDCREAIRARGKT